LLHLGKKKKRSGKRNLLEPKGNDGVELDKGQFEVRNDSE